jgi:hypothetical protein
MKDYGVLTTRIVYNFNQIIPEPNMQVAKRGLLDVIKKYNLGVGLRVLHQPSLATGTFSNRVPSTTCVGWSWLSAGLARALPALPG